MQREGKKKKRLFSFLVLSPCEDAMSVQPGKGPSPDHAHTGLSLSYSRTIRNKFLWCIR